MPLHLAISGAALSSALRRGRASYAAWIYSNHPQLLAALAAQGYEQGEAGVMIEYALGRLWLAWEVSGEELPDPAQFLTSALEEHGA